MSHGRQRASSGWLQLFKHGGIRVAFLVNYNTSWLSLHVGRAAGGEDQKHEHSGKADLELWGGGQLTFRKALDDRLTSLSLNFLISTIRLMMPDSEL